MSILWSFSRVRMLGFRPQLGIFHAPKTGEFLVDDDTAERDTEENRRRREEFLQLVGTIAPERLIFLGESGVTVGMTRLYARARRGVRVYEATPQRTVRIST
jgi:hypothetical protein